MTRVHDAHFTGLWVAQCAKRAAWKTGGNVSFDVPVQQPEHRANAATQWTGPGTASSPPITSGCAVAPAPKRQVNAEASAGSASKTLAIGRVGIAAAGVAPGPLTHQRPGPVDCRADAQPSPAVPSVAAVGAPLYALVHYCRAAGLPEPVPEYVFHPTRRWRFDFAFPLHKIAVEVDGGVWTQGRHTRGAGYIADMEKMNAAAKLGWRVLKYTPQTLGVAIDDLRVVLA